MTVGPGDRRDTVMQLLRAEGKSGVVDAGSCSTKTSMTASARSNKGMRSCRSMRWTGWVGASEERGLVTI